MNDIVCISPVDGSEVARRRVASDSEVAATLAAAGRAQREWSKVPLAERKAKILAFLAAMQAQNDEVVPELAMQMGRPVRYGGELRSLEERVRALVELSEEALAPLVPVERPGFRRMIKRVPAGIVLVIAPWNYPYLTAVNAIVPALLSGNAVILKHAAQTLLVGERFQSAMNQVGLPKGLFTTLTLDHAAAEKLIASRAVDHVNFTGSVAGGQAIERAAAGTFTTLGWNWVERILPMSELTRISISRSNSSSTAPSTIRVSAAAASNASMCMRRSMTGSSAYLRTPPRATSLETRLWRARHWGRWRRCVLRTRSVLIPARRSPPDRRRALSRR
jgi:aldehyde dehydrogenase family protein